MTRLARSGPSNRAYISYLRQGELESTTHSFCNARQPQSSYITNEKALDSAVRGAVTWKIVCDTESEGEHFSLGFHNSGLGLSYPSLVR